MLSVQDRPAPPRPSPLARLLRPTLGKTLLLAGLLLLIHHVCYVVCGSNFHVVVPQRLYRCAQPNAKFLEDVVPHYGIRTVINLRGYNANEAWCREECEALDRLGVPVIHVAMAAASPTEETQFHLLIKTLDEAPGPVLIHCMGGNDRSGVAAAAYLMLKSDTPPDTARRQLSLRYGHFKWGRAGCQHDVLDLYDTWLREQRLDHSPRRFHHWGTRVFQYAGGPLTKDGPRPTNRNLDYAEAAQ